VVSHEIRWRNALFIANYAIKRFFFAQDQNFLKFHKTDKKNFFAKTKNTCLMILNDKPNCQVSRILITPRPIYVKSSENHSLHTKNCEFCMVSLLECNLHSFLYLCIEENLTLLKVHNTAFWFIAVYLHTLFNTPTSDCIVVQDLWFFKLYFLHF
jgi:hypothetical protein